jgi:hypothetical protein
VVLGYSITGQLDIPSPLHKEDKISLAGPCYWINPKLPELPRYQVYFPASRTFWNTIVLVSSLSFSCLENILCHDVYQELRPAGVRRLWEAIDEHGVVEEV